MRLLYLFLVQLVSTVLVVLGAGGIESYVPNAYPTYATTGQYYPNYYQPYPYHNPYQYPYRQQYRYGGGYNTQQYGYGNYNSSGGLGVLGSAGLMFFGFFSMMFMCKLLSHSSSFLFLLIYFCEHNYFFKRLKTM